MKYYKIVHGFDDNLQYFPITSDELHKAYVIAMQGGKAIFENGFFNNRGNDIIRIIPDWHRERGWNKGYKMEAADYQDVKELEEPYRKTLERGKLLAEFIVKEGRKELLNKTASEAFQEVKFLESPKAKEVSEEVKKLSDKFKL